MHFVLIARILALALALFAASAPAFAENPPCGRNATFKREFNRDIEGGHYQIGEDPEISLRFRETGSVAADVRIIEPHRTKDFGSGVVFLFCDATGRNGVWVYLIDNPDTRKLRMRVIPVVDGKTGDKDFVPRKDLSLSPQAINRVTFRMDEDRRLVIGVDGKTVAVDPGADIHFLRVQIYCSKSFVRFLEGELMS